MSSYKKTHSSEFSAKAKGYNRLAFVLDIAHHPGGHENIQPCFN